MTKRCAWAGPDPLYLDYHDTEWGVPAYDGRELWEKLILDGFQAGLSWITILRKRESFREAFASFDPVVVADWGDPEVAKLLQNPGIVRHKGKIEATIGNARAYLEMGGAEAFSAFLWDHVNGKPIQNKWRSPEQVPPQTDLSRQISRRLKERGFKFCGPTIVYAVMQAMGMVNDHQVDCYRHAEVALLGDAARD